MSSRCTLCGELFSAGAEHVCPDDLTASVDPDQPEPPPPASQAGLGAEESDPLIGTTLADRYAIVARVSQGGMGVVYRARHTLLNSIVAVKVLLKQEDDIDQRRFLQEAQLASKIAHPNIVYIADYGLLPDGRPYLVMEYIEAPTLGRVLRRAKGNRIDTLRACKLAVQIARGMQVVHDKGIVHRE
jgi:eukaryotic-like serine/threonine-protein kinase